MRRVVRLLAATALANTLAAPGGARPVEWLVVDVHGLPEDAALSYQGRRVTPALGEVRGRGPSALARPAIGADDADDDDDEDEDGDEDEDEDGDDDADDDDADGDDDGDAGDDDADGGDDDDDAGTATATGVTPTVGTTAPAGTSRRASAVGAADDDDSPLVPLTVDVAALAGYDDNPDEVDEPDRTATFGVEAAAKGTVGSEADYLAIDAEAGTAITPAVAETQRFFVDAELAGTLRLNDTLNTTTRLAASRYALSQPQEQVEAASQELAFDGGGITAKLRAGAEQRRYRDTTAVDDDDDEEDDGDDTGGDEDDGDVVDPNQPVRNQSDNALLRQLDYRRYGAELELAADREWFANPFVAASLYRVHFPNPSDEVADRDAYDLSVTGGVELGLAEDVDLALGLRYNERGFRDDALGHARTLSPSIALEIDRDWIDLTAGFHREFASPELTNATVRDAQIYEIAAELRPHRRWGLFLEGSYEIGHERGAGARDRELEVTSRIEYLLAPRVRLLLEAYHDRYRYTEPGEDRFAYNRTTLRTGLKGRF